jgi:hypothetical protein
VNLYAYVGNDPVNLVDPMGTQALALCAFGPAPCTVGIAQTAIQIIAAGGAVAAMASLPGDSQNTAPSLVTNNMFIKPPANAWDQNGPKAPGYPGDYPGIGADKGIPYKDPKGGPNWVQNPNGKGWGWESGNDVWVPTGQGGLAHGGPHYDVQVGKGNVNVYPPKNPSSEFRAFEDSDGGGGVFNTKFLK